MTNGSAFDKPAKYQIIVKGKLDHKWSDWFDGFAIEPLADDDTLLAGTAADQAALYGLLLKLHNLGLPLISVVRAAQRSPDS